jgi:two-component system sensor histidine kinase/response regulator
MLNTLSHELLTPMNGIIGLTELALHGELADEQRELVSLAHASAHRLLGTIQDLLIHTALEAGRFSLFPDPISPKALIDEIWPDLLAKARDKHLQFKLHLADDLPPLVTLDIGQVRRVMQILIGNAIKFTHIGGVTVTLEKQPDTGSGLHICIADTGIGIAPDKLNTIFDSFSQADAGLNRKFGGLGIGLAIAWQLIALMNGELFVDSELGAGSRFHVFLPCSQPPVEPCVATSSSR